MCYSLSNIGDEQIELLPHFTNAHAALYKISSLPSVGSFPDEAIQRVSAKKLHAMALQEDQS